MKKLLIISLMLCLSLSLFADWELLSQANFPTTFSAINRVDANTIWAVGSGGAVVKTTDNAESWSFVPTPAFNTGTSALVSLNDVHFISSTHGAISGGSGFLITTTDGGQTWTQSGDILAQFGTGGVTSVHYLNDGKMWVTGSAGMLMYSENHGQTWAQQTTGVTANLNDVYVTSTGLGFIGGASGTILKTTDFGTTWAPLSTGYTTVRHINKITHKDNIFVLTGQAATMAVSTDNGENFTAITFTGPNNTQYCYEAAILSDNTIIGVGALGTIFEVQPGQTAGTTRTNNFYDIVRTISVDANDLIVSAASYGSILKSNDNALTFEYAGIVPSYDYYAAAVTSENTFFVSGNRHELYKFENGTKTKIELAEGNNGPLWSVKFINENVGFVTGKTYGIIHKTTDGGETWTTFTVEGFPAAKAYYDLIMVNENVGYALGCNFNVKTTDGGETWTYTGDVGISNTEIIYAGHFFNETTGFAAGRNGALYYTSDSAANWTNFTLGTTNLMDVFFVNDNIGFVVNVSGQIFKTSNGGLSAEDWTLIQTDVELSNLSEMTIDDNGVLWLAAYATGDGNNGTDWAILKSEDMGETWTYETFPELTFNPSRLRATAYNDGKLLMVGNNGVILSRNIEVEEPQGMNLFFSEYIEGSSNNKAIEIFNPFPFAVDLDGYVVRLGANGGNWNNTLNLQGTLASHGVYVIYNSSAHADIIAVGDIASNVTFFNGDDALGLFHNGELIDVIGVYQQQPSTGGWTVAGVANATVDHTLVRKPTVDRGNLDWAAQAGTNAADSEWIVYPVNTFTYLGSHEFIGSGVDITASPVINPASGLFFDAINVSIACETEGAVIYYTVDGSTPNENSTLYTETFEVSETTTVKAIAYAPNHLPSLVVSTTYNFPVLVDNVASLRGQDADNQTIYRLTGEAVLSFSHSFRNQKYLQDDTAGILIDDFPGIIQTTYNIGDGISNVTGKLSVFNGMLQFIPTLDPGAATSTNNELVPILVSFEDLVENLDTYQARLVKVENVQFATEGNFANGTDYTVNDGTSAYTFRTNFFDVDYIGTAIPSNPAHITGLISTRNTGSHIAARFSADIEETQVEDDLLLPVRNLSAQVDGNDVTLTWEEPGIESGWFTHALLDEYNNSIGTGAAAEFTVVQRFSPSQLASFGVAGAQLTTVSFMPNFATAEFTVKVWTGGSGSPLNPGTLVAEQFVGTAPVQVWKEVELTTPINIPIDQELWIGYHLTTTGGHPAGCDAGPAVQAFGNVMYFNNAWTTLTALNASLNFNWMIKGYAEAPGTVLAFSSKNAPLNVPVVETTSSQHIYNDVVWSMSNNNLNISQANIQRNQNRVLLGYNVYREDELLTETPINETVYVDENVPTGEYTYYVKAIYTSGESFAAELTVLVGDYIIVTFPWSEGFEGPSFPPIGWSLIDNDFDGHDWFQLISEESAHTGVKSAASASWLQTPLFPDNWLVTPALQLPSVGENQSIYLRYYIAAQDEDWPMEHYSVMVSAVDLHPSSFNTLFSETLTSAEWSERSLDLSAYQNQTVFVAFRHHNVTDMFYIKLDDVWVGLGTSESDLVATPAMTNLIGNYPNPFNPETVIKFSVAQDGPVSLDIYNIRGQKVKTLVNDNMSSGTHQVVWTGKDDNDRQVGSGIYFYRMRSGKYTSTRKMILMK